MIDFNSHDEALEIMLAQDKQLVAVFNRNKLAEAHQKLKNWHQTWDGWAVDKIGEAKPTTVDQQALNELQYRELFKTTPIYGTDCHKAVITLLAPLADPYTPMPVIAAAEPAKKAAKKAKPNPFDGKPK